MASSRRCVLLAIVGFVALTGCGTGTSASSPEHQTETRSSRPGDPAPDEERTIAVLGINDLHGHVERLPLLAGYVEALEVSGEVDGVVVVDAGDMFQGTLASNLTEGASVIRGYNELGLAAATVGNHEFDFGPEGELVTPQSPGDDPRGALKARAREARFPILTANLVDRETRERVRWGMPPTATVEVAGLTVGIVGVTTVDTLGTTLAANVADLRVGPLTETIRRHAHDLRRAGADFVVVSAHAGARCDAFHDPEELSSCDRGEIIQVAERLGEGLVDVIVAGHTHRGVAHDIGGVPVIESFAYGVAFGRVDLTVRGRGASRTVRRRIHPPTFLCGDRATPLEDCPPARYAGQDVTPSEAVAVAVASDLERAEALRSRSLGVEVTGAFANTFGVETPLSNLLADLIRAARDGDVGLMNGGGIRAPWAPGPLLYGDFFETFPFDNRFAVVELTGAELSELIAANLRADRGFLSVSGVRGEARCEEGQVRVRLRDERGRPIPPGRRLRVVTSDYLATTPNPVFTRVSAEGRLAVEQGEPMREVLVRALEAQGGERDPTAASLDRRRVRYPERPMRCDPR